MQIYMDSQAGKALVCKTSMRGFNSPEWDLSFKEDLYGEQCSYQSEAGEHQED